MKRLLSLVLILALLCPMLSLTSCVFERCEHKWDGGVLLNATECRWFAIAKFTCIDCGRIKLDWAANHNYVAESIVDPTCSSMGHTKYICTLCDKEYVDGFVAARGHNYDTDLTIKKETCTTSGVYAKICSNCNDIYRYSVNATGHSYVLVSSENTASTYECQHCAQAITLNDEETIEDFIDNNELFDVEPTFSFDIVTSQDENFIRDNLKILDYYYNNSEYEDDPTLLLQYTLQYKGNNVWNVSTISNYEYDRTYIAKLQNGLTFAEYMGEELTFTVVGNPNHENTYEYSDSIVFLQVLENQNPGYYPYEIDSYRESEYLYLTINKIDGLQKGMILCVGNITSFEQITSDTECNIGKIYDFYTLSDGRWMVVLEEPDITEIFTQLDISYNEEINLEDADIDTNQIKDEVLRSLYESEDFIRFLSVLNLSASKYFAENGYYAEELSDTESFMDKIKITVSEPKFEGNKLIEDIDGELILPIKTDADLEIGTFKVCFNFHLESKFKLDAYYTIIEHWILPDEILSFNFQITQTDTISFDFDISIDIDYSLEENKYVQHIETKAIHHRGCARLDNVKDNSKLTGLTAIEAEKLISNDSTLECKICKPISGFSSCLIVFSKNSKTIHKYGCYHANTISEENKVVTDEKPSVYLEQGYSCCLDCFPENREEKEYTAFYTDTLHGSDWKKISTNIAQWAKDSNVSERSKAGVTLLTKNFPIYGPITAKLTINFVLELNIEANLEYGYTYEQVNTYGIRKVNDGMQPYSEKISSKVTRNECSVMGKIEVKAGVSVTAEITIYGCSKWISAGLGANVGAYARISGVLSWSDTTEEKYDYMAAYFEAGVYLDVNAFYKILWWDGSVTLYEKQWPLLVLGYEKAYFNYTTYHDKLVINGSFDIDKENLLEVKYFDLKTMQTGIKELLLTEDVNYKVKIDFKDGRYCKIENGIIVATDDAPQTFTDVMIITVECDDKWDNFEKGSSVFYLGTYEIDLIFILDKDNTGSGDNTGDGDNTGSGDNTGDNNKPSASLEFTLNNDGKSYSVTGIGTITDTDIVIPKRYNGLSVTSIGNGAFADCTSLTSVTIGDSVMSIGDYAFENCTSLASVVIPDRVTSIGNGAFADCTSLTGITIGDSVMSIGGYAFENCTSLASVVIPDRVTSIGNGAFADCTSLTSVTIGDSVMSIGDYAFDSCIALANVNIPNSVTRIGKNTFYNCASLVNVEIPNSVTSIGDRAFYGCVSLTSIEIPNSVMSIGEEAFYYCTLLTGINIPKSVTSIGANAFAWCTSLESLSLADGIVSIGENMFYYCTALTEVNIPNSVTSVAKNAFYGCTSLTSVEISNSVTSIGEYAFGNCSSLISVVIPNRVTSIANGTFSNCDSLESIVIPSSVKSIGDEAFSNCKSLTSIYYNGTIDQWRFVEIRWDAQYITSTYTIYCVDGEITKDGTLTYYYPISEGLDYTLNDDGKTYSLTGIGTCTDTVIVIPDTHNGKPVTSIGEYAFWQNTSITSVYVPYSVISIDREAFWSCESLTSVTIANSLTRIDEAAFAYCSSLTQIYIPDSVTSIGTSAFTYCDSLRSVYIGNSVTSIGDFAFSFCTTLNKLTIGNAVTTIGYAAFTKCTSLTSVTIPNSVVSIDSCAFSDCTSLVRVSLPNNITTIRPETFYGCVALTSITIPDSVTSIGDCAFWNCTNLKTVTIPNSVLRIGDQAFYCCYKLNSIHYSATTSEWNDISKGYMWDYDAGFDNLDEEEIAEDYRICYSVYCTDTRIPVKKKL